MDDLPGDHLPIHLIVPMSGQGRRFAAAGHLLPKPLIDVGGSPMIARVLAQYPSEWPAHFVLASNHQQTALPETLRSLRPDAPQHVVAPHDEGPGRALEAALPSLPEDAPILVSYCDFGLVWDAQQFSRLVALSGCDACVISYRGFQPHYARPTPYSYSRLDKRGEQVLEVREKQCFTSDRSQEFAGAGAYYFRSARLARRALAYQREHKLRHNGELYTSLTVQALRQMEPAANIRVFAATAFLQWGTPEDLADYLYWHRAWQARLSVAASATSQVAQVAMPMAGGGSRFRALTDTPKPLISLGGQAMYERALASLPAATHAQVFVTRQSEAAAVRSRQAGTTPSQVVALQATPPGQALSTRAGLLQLDPQQAVLVSACDHAIGLDPAAWQNFQSDPRCDAAIFTVVGYPGASRSPNSYAYVQPCAGEPGHEEPFGRVAKVSVKQPLSARPNKDAVVVGTFWCRRTSLLLSYIDLLEARDLRVNGELYLDSVFALMLADGLTVRHVPLTGYFNWGTPDALRETCYYEQVFTGVGSGPVGP